MQDSGIWKNRIVGYAEVDPNELLANADNWRTHPMFQREVVEDSLVNTGWLQDVIVNTRDNEEWPPDDRIPTVLDGHLRVLLALDANQPVVPIKYVNLTPNEEKIALMTLDPSSALASADREKLQELLERVSPMSEVEVTFLSDLAEQYSVLLADLEGEDIENEPIEQNKDYVKFTFGEYSGLIEKPVYEDFVTAFEQKKDITGESMLSDVLRAWLGL